jgi:PAS domain S-box-containing protein
MTDLGSAAKLRPVFELSPTVLAVSSLDDGRLLDVNNAFLSTTGWSREDVIGRPIPELDLWVDPEVRQAGLGRSARARGSAPTWWTGCSISSSRSRRRSTVRAAVPASGSRS